MSDIKPLPMDRQLPPDIQRLFDRICQRQDWWDARRAALRQHARRLSDELERTNRALDIVQDKRFKLDRILCILETGRKPASWRKRIYSPAFGVTQGATTKPLAYMHSAGGEEGSGGLENAVRALEDAR